MEAATPGECGGTLPAPEHDARLEVSSAFPEQAKSEKPTFTGTVTITNATERRIDGLAASQPDLYITQRGRIVATPLPRDDIGLIVELAPGAAREFRTEGSLRRCSDQQPLAPGAYELHAVLRFGDGTAATGGPWPLEVS